MRVGVIVTAAGSGARLGAAVPKALVTVGERTLLEHAVARALSVADELVVTAPESHLEHVRTLVNPLVEQSEQRDVETSLSVVRGGASRQDSVNAGLAALGDVDLVLVHDAARAFAPMALFRDAVAALESGHGAVIPALPVVDTIKRADAELRVTGTVDRSELWAVQTPQGFRRELLERAHTEGAGTGATDDAALVEALGEPVQLIPGHEDAFKVTTPRDLALAESLMAKGHFDE